MMDEDKILLDFKTIIEQEDKVLIYGAGEFASIVVRYCTMNGLASKIVNCVVTKKNWNTPEHILGIPVIDFEHGKWRKDILIIIAILAEESKNDVKYSLKNRDYCNLYCMIGEEFRAIYEKISDFSIGIQNELRRLIVQNERQQHQYENISLLIQSMPTVVETHKKTFDKYKDINKGKVIVVCAPGPSLNKYKYDDKYVHIGLNSLLFNDEIKLDYYFNQHIPLGFDFYGNGCDVHPDIRKRYLEYFSKLKCIKFLGQKIGNDWVITPPFGNISDLNCEFYYISDIEMTHRFCPDIRYNFLYGSTSIIFPALQFALFTNPRKIFIVGSDGYSISGENYYQRQVDHELEERLGTRMIDMLPSVNEQMERIYKDFHKFALASYPNTEIIMVNPVYFKGIFKETITDENGQILL